MQNIAIYCRHLVWLARYGVIGPSDAFDLNVALTRTS